MQKIIHNNFAIAILLNAVLFISFFLLFSSCFNTDTDIYFLYTLSGGYGNEPSALLHYSDIAHPLLTSIVAAFFTRFPSFNWYSFFLLLFHFISCIVLLYSFLNYFKKYYAIVIFIIFFLFIECRLLLWLDFSGVSLIGMIGGSISLLLYFKKDPVAGSYSKRVFLFGLLILLAGLIRLHYMALFGAFAVCIGLFFLSRNQLIKFTTIHLLLGVLVLLFFQGQRLYFQKKIPGWNEEEKMRKADIYYSNHPRKNSLSIQKGMEKLKQDLISISLVYDKKLIDYNAVKNFGKNNTTLLNLPGNNPQTLYWLYMDVRLYLFLFGVLILFFVINRDWRFLFRFICVSLFFILAFFTIGLFFKGTEVILVTILSSIILSGFLFFNYQSEKTSTRLAFVLLLLSSGWMIIRIAKISYQNKQKISFTRNVIKELNNHKNILFIDAGNSFTFNLSIWDVPQKYPMYNFVYDELFYSNSYNSQLHRYGITDLMKEIPEKENIYLVGENASIPVEYYKILYNQDFKEKRIPGFKYISAYQIIPDTDK